MNKTRHAKIRQQQRGIKNETIDLLFKYGKFRRQKGGTGILTFPRKVKPSIEKQHLSEFQKRFEEEVNNWLGKDIIDDTLITDGELHKNECNLQTAELLKQSGPWGQGFPEPIFHGEFDVIQQRTLADKHLKLVLKNSYQDFIVDAIYFFAPEECLSESLARVELVYKLSINEFRGESSLQLIVEQLKKLK